MSTRLEPTIVTSMARALWVTAYASWAEENRDDPDIVRARSGEDWMGAAPETPKLAMKAARDLVHLFEVDNGTDGMVALFRRAMAAMRKRATKDDEETAELAETFGHYMAMQAMGEGVSWFDDHPTFAVVIPKFEIHFDGESLVWSGLASKDFHGGSRGAGRQATGKQLFLVLMVNTDPSDTYAVPLASRSDEDVKNAIHKAIDLALPDDKDSLEYTVVEASDAGAARLPTRQTMSQTWKLYKGRGRPTTNPSNPSHWPSSHVQSILFDTAQFSVDDAKRWAKEHGYHYDKVDTTLHYHRLRQEAPMGGPCRTIEFGTGIKAIVCASGGGHARPPGVPGGH